MLDLIGVSDAGIYKSRHALTYLFNLFTFVGINPPQQRSRRYYCLYYFYSVTVNSICCLFMPFSYHMGYIKLMHQLSRSELLSTIQSAIHVSSITVKTSVITLHMKRLRRAFDILDQLDENYTQHEDLAKLRECVRRCRKMVLIFCLPFYSFEALTIGLGVLQKRPPLALWLPFFSDEPGRWEYLLIVLWDIFFMFMLLTLQMSSDVFPPIFMNIMCTHTQLLVARVSRLGRVSALSVDENFAELQACIRTQVQIMRIAEIVRPIFSITLFTQFATTASTLLTWVGNVEYPENIILIAFVSCQVLQIFPCCFFASQLVAECERLPDAIFHCNWMDQDRRFRGAIAFFIQSSQNPIRFSCLKLFDVHLETSVAIAKFAFSLYTFLQETGVSK